MFHLSVITAEKAIFNGDVEMLVAPTETGEVGILAHHHPLIAKLSAGPLKIKHADGTEQILFVAGGYLEVSNNTATVLADTAENIEEIEKDQAAAARAKAEELLHAATDDTKKAALQNEIRIQQMRETLADVAKYRKK